MDMNSGNAGPGDPGNIKCALSGDESHISEYIRFMSKMLEPMTMPFVVSDAHGKIISSNNAFSSLTGYTIEELSDMSIADLAPSWREAKLSRANIQLFGEKAPINIEKEYVRKDGSKVPVKLYLDFICNKDGQPIYYYAFVTNLSERKHLESVLRRYRLIFESARDIILFTDESGRIIEMNDAAEKAYGYTHQELLSMSIADLRMPEDRPSVPKQIERCLKAGCLYETMHVRKDGSTFHVEINSRGTTVDGSKVIIGVIRDITERKRFEEELEDAKERAELYVDLMSHDINNMNMVGMGYLELALSEPGLNESEKALLEKPLEELRESTALISIVKTLRRAETVAANLKAVDLGGILEELCTQYANMPGKGVTINYTPVTGCTVIADELVKDVFSNLIWNAIKHSGEHVVIDIRLARAREHGNEYWRAEVSDNGPGIPDELKKKLFLRYQRGRTRAPGSGLGLYLVNMLVKNFKGRVWAEDRVKGDQSKGSRFVVLLPAAT